jgi:hypothetical protein
MAVRIIEKRDGVIVESIKKKNGLYQCATIKAAETFCAIRNLPILEERVKL